MTTPIRIGILRLADSAPVVVAATRGIFADLDIEARISVEPSWANIADKLAYGLMDAAVLLPPLVLASAIGLRGAPAPVIVPMGLTQGGNRIVFGRETGLVRGYYLMVAGGVRYKLVSGKGQRRMPDPVPVLVMPRIAVDKAARVHQLGLSLFKDALERAEAMSQHAGVQAFLVYALDDRARRFYLEHGFQPSVLDPAVLVLRVPTGTV